jgi:hypothetical protein
MCKVGVPEMWLNAREDRPAAATLPLSLPPHQLWDEDHRWILMFDNLLKHPGGKTKGCKCDVHGELLLREIFIAPALVFGVASDVK